MFQFGLFLLVTAVLIVRPTDLIPGLAGLPIYELVVLGALLVSAPKIAGQLMPAALAARPVTAFVLGVLAAVVASHLVRLRTWEAQDSGLMYLKVALYYLLLVASIRSVSRLRLFLRCVVGLMAVHVGFALLQYAGAIDVETLRSYREKQLDLETGLTEELPRLRGAGIFNDPNEFCVLLSVGVLLSLYLLGDRRAGAGRGVWVIPLAAFATAVPLTHSRGGMLALLAGLGAFAADRYGLRRGLLILAVTLPVVLVALAGRQTSFDLTDPNDTSQHRVLLWSDGLMLFRESPLFGTGQGTFPELAGQAAHNSFIEAYAEIGLLGGSCFFAAVAYPVWALWRLRRRLDPQRQPGLCRLRGYLLASLVTQTVGMMSLSRIYTQPTYLLIGLGTVFLGLAAEVVPGAAPRLNPRLAFRLAVAGGACLAALHVLTVLLVNRS
ncbi:O-antigen ligase family protein [bacterium]|nr:O-antigen ligase family protein [bacterium]